MKLAMRKIIIVFWLQLQLIIKNMTLLIAPLMSIGYVIVFGKIVIKGSSLGYFLSIGMLCNVAMGGIMMSSMSLAAEKEKKTLQFLWDSSVSPTEYFCGNALAIEAIIVITSLILIPAGGIRLEQISLVNYLIMTIICTLISILLGYIVGIISPNQTVAGIIGLPVMFFFAVLPMFKIFSQTVYQIVSHSYSGILMKFIAVSLSKASYHWSVSDIGTLIIWFLSTLILLILLTNFELKKGK